MNCCIGHYNRAHFVRFLISVMFGTFYSLGLLSLRLYILILNQEYRYRYERLASPTFLGFDYDITYPASSSELILFCINAIVLLLLVISVGILTVYQLSYIFSGQTTIENFELHKLDDLVTKDYIQPRKAVFPFNNGIIENIKEMFGPNPLLWMLPQKMHGDGVHFKVNDIYKNKTIVIWPPPEYYR